MQIFQISDVHCGPQFNRESYDHAVEEINREHPNVVLVTGDLTENGILSEYRLAKVELAKIKCKRKIILAGNHDYRSTGYLIFKRYFASPQLTKIGRLAIFTLSTARPDRDEGEVGYRQNLWLANQMRRRRRSTVIVALHHHLVPVPDTGPERLTVLDAGDTLRNLFEEKADLVLCGHRHRPWKWTLGDLPIVHAGTVSSQRTRGLFANTYNEINVTGRDIEASLKVVNGKRMDFSTIMSMTESLRKTIEEEMW